MVYCAALRKVAGDVHLARDVAQTVFTDLARKARSLPRDVVLAGWLYRHACLKAVEAIRAESRRRVREQTAAEMKLLNNADDVLWRDVEPVLDEAMQRLSNPDRDALVLRFFQNASLREVGESLGITEDAAQKRITRALDKLRTALTSQGVTCTATVLATTLVGTPTKPCPPAWRPRCQARH
jgi:RNA polymerase sigma factor (sigma-70 family)